MAGPPAGGHKAELPGTISTIQGAPPCQAASVLPMPVSWSLWTTPAIYTVQMVTPPWLPAWRNFIVSGSARPFFLHVPTWSCVLPLNIIAKRLHPAHWSLSPMGAESSYCCVTALSREQGIPEMCWWQSLSSTEKPKCGIEVNKHQHTEWVNPGCVRQKTLLEVVSVPFLFLTRYHGRDNLQKKGFIWGLKFQGSRVQDHHGREYGSRQAGTVLE